MSDLKLGFEAGHLGVNSLSSIYDIAIFILFICLCLLCHAFYLMRGEVVAALMGLVGMGGCLCRTRGATCVRVVSCGAFASKCVLYGFVLWLGVRAMCAVFALWVHRCWVDAAMGGGILG